MVLSKNLRNDKKNNKNDGFLMFFWSFWVLGPILAHQTAKFKLSGQFRFSRHPWGPWGRLSRRVICISKIYQLFCDSGAALVDFFKLMKMLPNVSFISMVIKKVFLSVSIATISNFLQKCTLWGHNYETSQPKIGQSRLAKLDISAVTQNCETEFLERFHFLQIKKLSTNHFRYNTIL